MGTRRIYLLLMVMRLFFALSPSYIHPDENFQGPEVIAGQVFSFPHHLTWEFTSDRPVRSFFALWPVYGLPMIVLQWVWTETGKEEVAPKVIYYILRTLMFILSFVLEDWAIHELVQSPRQRRLAVVLVASSYVTWTYQTHTFSNSIETLVVVWSLVMIQRILDNKQRSSLVSSALLGSLITFGIFNRITFPAFLLAPGFYLLPHFLRRPFSLLALSLTTFLTTLLAITIDTAFYRPAPLLHSLLHHPTFTPLNSLLYNASTANLSLHGLHPPYQHIFISLPLLLGPSLLLIPLLRQPNLRTLPAKLPLLSALTSTLLLSLIPHQEPRFLLPAVPLILSSVHLPRSRLWKRYWVSSWMIFNLVFGVLMGVYHQGGVVPTQIWLGKQARGELLGTGGAEEVFWWRTYSPPIWLLDGNGLRTTDLMGMGVEEMRARVVDRIGECTDKDDGSATKSVGLVAPWSSTELDAWMQSDNEKVGDLRVEEVWRYGRHLNLDDLDFGGEGVWRTLKRVVGRRGLVVWRVGRICVEDGKKLGR